MFSHGSCGYPGQSTFLTALLASQGFIVAAPPHPGNTIYEIQTCMSGAALTASFQERPADIIFATDQMLAANQDGASPFFGSIDPTRIGMSGHSFGGLTTYLVVDRDSRYRIAVPLAPAVLGDTVMTIPSLSMISELDSYVNNDRVRSQYAAASAPKLEVEIEHTGHFAYSDGCFPSPDCNPPTTLTQDEAHAIVQRWVVPFVQRYLKGDASYAPFFEVVPPGVIATQEGVAAGSGAP
jgi:predicted dienelactone hydrolase